MLTSMLVWTTCLAYKDFNGHLENEVSGIKNNPDLLNVIKTTPSHSDNFSPDFYLAANLYNGFSGCIEDGVDECVKGIFNGYNFDFDGCMHDVEAHCSGELEKGIHIAASFS